MRLLRRPSAAAAAVVFRLLAAAAPLADADQSSTGTVAGIVQDRLGVAVAGAEVVVTSEQTAVIRRVVTADDGRYVVALLAPGIYSVEIRLLPRLAPAQSAVVRAGMEATVDVILDVAAVAEAVTVTGETRGGQTQVTSVIERAQIDEQPLNGRNVFEVVKAEPGVAAPARLGGGRVFVAPHGAGQPTIPRVGFTRTTADSGNIETPGTVGTVLQISPDAVDQVQVSTANFDQSSGAATSGVVDLVSRSGGQYFRSSAFSLYRDPEWSAAQAGIFGGAEAEPEFRRRQVGITSGGPLRRNRAFFFVAYERHDQKDDIEVAPAALELQALGGTFTSPYSSSQITARVDVRVTEAHHLFVRYSGDKSRALVPDGVSSLPSAWAQRPIHAQQTLASFTSIIGSAAVNDLRVSSYKVGLSSGPATVDDCEQSCVGLGAPRVLLSEGGPPVLSIGNAAMSSNRALRFQLSDTFVWSHGSHLIRVGVDWEHTANTLVSVDSDPVQLTLWTPDAARQRNPSIALPSELTSLDAILQLPLRNFTISVGPGEILQRGLQPVRRFDVIRGHISDRWQWRPRISLNAGVSWLYDAGVLNHDLRKPAWLTPIVGRAGLEAPAARPQVSGGAGLVWRATEDGRTMVRAAVGRYVESLSRTAAQNLSTERVALSPIGTGRVIVSGTNLFWNGQRLNFTQPTGFSGADLLAILPQLRAGVGASLDLDNRDFSIVNLDAAKEGRNLYDPAYTSPSAIHASAGVERAVSTRLTVAADVVWKRFANTFINGIDYNRFFSATGPVIPACAPAARADVAVECSNGSIYFDTTSGRARYAGLLLRADARFRDGQRLRASYALGSFVGSNGTGVATTENPDGRVFGFNNDDWFENYGPLPTDIRHLLHVSGSVATVWGIRLSFAVSASSRAPFSAYVAGADFNGDGTINDLLPGTRVNQFNRGLDRGDLVRLVAEYNQHYAGKPTLGGQRPPVVTLPDDFAFNDNFFTLDLRLSRSFAVNPTLRIVTYADVFNALNTVNFVGYSGNLTAPSSFGRPSGRVGQAYGSGGPRAAQLGVRVLF